VSGTGVAWEYESFGSQGLAIASQYGDPGTVYRGAGIGTVEGDDVTLTGRLTVADPFSRGPLTFRLKRSGSALKGTARGPANVPVDVEFVREPPRATGRPRAARSVPDGPGSCARCRDPR
jgi:hypothetical protein